MSLFKARDWWSTTVGEDEEFDQGCLCVGNLDNAEDELGMEFDNIDFIMRFISPLKF